MNLSIQIGLAAGIMMLVASGCSTTGCGVGCSAEDGAVRGQSPEIYHSSGVISPQESQVQQVGHRVHGRPLAEVRGAIHNHMHGTERTFHAEPTITPAGFRHHHGGCPTAGCPTAGCPTGNCPTGHYGHHGYGGWDNGYCHSCRGHCHKGCIRHYQTYSVSRPNDLSYPAQNQPGGVTSYPYYTFKGPDDFFKKD